MPSPMGRFAALLSSRLWMAVLAAAVLQGAAAKPQPPPPIPVTFGPNINLSTGPHAASTVQREPTVAVNPDDPNNIVEGNIDRLSPSSLESNSYSYSTDGGATWTFGGEMTMESSDDSSGDPWLAAGENGVFYYGFLEEQNLGGQALGYPNLMVAKSTDGGRTFPTLSAAVVGGPNGTNSLLDKDAIAADVWPASPFRGTVYAAFTSVGSGGFQIAVVASRDGGQSWTRPTFISPALNVASSEVVIGALPVVGPDGAVYVFYDDFDTGPLSIMFCKSTDGGVTWSRPAAVAANLPSPGFFLLKNSDPKWDTSSFGISANSFPTAAAAPNGMLSVAWVDFPRGGCFNGAHCTNADVRLSVSRNGGKTWSAPVKVSDDTGSSDQFYPAIASHPNGLLSLTWQDKRLDPLNSNYDTFYTNTFDGATFLPNVRVSDVTTPGGKGFSQNADYNFLAVGPDGIFPVWCDGRSGGADIYTATGRLSR